MNHFVAMEMENEVPPLPLPHAPLPQAPGALGPSDWIASTQALPRDGQHVEFVLEYRDIAMRGIFRERAFRTRWSRYEPASICEWRCVNPTFA